MAEALQRQLYRLQFNLANILRDLGHFLGCQDARRGGARGQREHLGEEHLHTLQTRSSLAGDMRALGEYKDALARDLETYELWSSGYGEEYRGTLLAAHNLALSYLLTGDFRRALTKDRLTLERRRALHGPAHPRTFNSTASVARDLLEAGRYGEAVAEAETLWSQCRIALGDNDRITLTSQHLLGVALRCAGHMSQAEAQINPARIGLSRAFGADSSDALACRLSQALDWLGMERYMEVRKAAEEVLAEYDERLGPVHPHSLICRLNISTALYLEKDYSAAELEARAAVEGLHERLGTDHPYTLAARTVLASVLARQGNLDEAESLERAVVERREAVLGPQHPDTVRSRATCCSPSMSSESRERRRSARR